MVDEITTNTQIPATKPPISDIPAEPASEPIQPVNSSESAGGILPEEISTEPTNSPLKNPIETNSEVQLENTVEEPTVQTQEQTQETPQTTETEKIEPISQPQIEELITQKEVETQEVSQEAVEPKQPEPEIQIRETVIPPQEQKQENIQTIEPKPPVFEVQKTVEVSNLSDKDRALLDSFKLNMKRARELLVKARMAIQFRKRKKLDKIMTLFQKKNEIKNDDVEKLLHISDATATVYLSILKKENKIKQSGKKGRNYSYVKI